MMVDELEFVEYKGTKRGWVKELNKWCAEAWRPVWSTMKEQMDGVEIKFEVWLFRKYSTKHRLNTKPNSKISDNEFRTAAELAKENKNND